MLCLSGRRASWLQSLERVGPPSGEWDLPAGRGPSECGWIRRLPYLCPPVSPRLVLTGRPPRTDPVPHIGRRVVAPDPHSPDTQQLGLSPLATGPVCSCPPHLLPGPWGLSPSSLRASSPDHPPHLPQAVLPGFCLLCPWLPCQQGAGCHGTVSVRPGSASLCPAAWVLGWHSGRGRSPGVGAAGRGKSPRELPSTPALGEEHRARQGYPASPRGPHTFPGLNFPPFYFF